MEQMSYEELESAYNELNENYLTLQQKYEDLQNASKIIENQYNKVIQQNQDLQSELRAKDSGKSTK